MLLTEALAEIKTIEKRIKTKGEFILRYLARPDALRDPHASTEGGSRAVIASEMQAVDDLLARRLKLRRAVHRANETKLVKVGGEERSIADWNVWRKEVAPIEESLLKSIRDRIAAVRQDASSRRMQLTDRSSEGAPRMEDVVINVDEKKNAEKIEALTKTLGDLDGALSVANATTNIEAID